MGCLISLLATTCGGEVHGDATSWTATSADASSEVDHDASDETTESGDKTTESGDETTESGDETTSGADEVECVEWNRHVGTTATDWGNAVAVDGNAGVYVVGQTQGVFDGWSAAGGWDAFIAKYDLAGNELWTRQIGTAGDDVALGVAADDDVGVYVAGYTAGALDGQSSAGGDDAFVMKLDGAGNELWTRQFGTATLDRALGVAADRGGAVYVTGWTGGDLDGESLAGSTDAFITKYDAVGTRLWTRLLGAPTLDQANAVAVDGSGGVYLVGHTSGVLDGEMSNGGRDAFLAKFDDVGTRLWVRQLGTPGHEDANAVAADGGGVYVVGGTDGEFPGQVSAGLLDAFVTRYDGAGEEAWTHQFGTPEPDEAFGVALDERGRVHVVGRTAGTLDGHDSSAGWDVFVVQYDDEGAKQWSRQFGTSSGTDGQAAAAYGRGRILVAGLTSGELPGATSKGGIDAFVAHLCAGED
jgi:hypothetical protein